MAKKQTELQSLIKSQIAINKSNDEILLYLIKNYNPIVTIVKGVEVLEKPTEFRKRMRAEIKNNL